MKNEQLSFIGSGDLYMDRLNADGTSNGLLKVGNATRFALKVDADTKKLTAKGRANHGQTLASMSRITGSTIGLTVNQIDPATLAAVFMGDAVAQDGAGGDVVGEPLVAKIGKLVELAHRNISAVVVKSAEELPGPPQVPETGTPDGLNTGTGDMTGVSGGDDVQVGTYTITCTDTTSVGSEVWSVTDPDSAALADAITGVPYVNNQIEFTINRDTEGGAVEFAVGDEFTVEVTATAAIVTYTDGTDYAVNTRLGTIEALAAGAITADQELAVDYTWAAESGVKITGATKPEVRVSLLLDGKNDYDGEPAIVRVWDAKLIPSGPVDFLGDDWAELPFDGEMLTPTGKAWPFEIL